MCVFVYVSPSNFCRRLRIDKEDNSPPWIKKRGFRSDWSPGTNWFFNYRYYKTRTVSVESSVHRRCVQRTW